MGHLSREELVDSLDESLPLARLAHVDICAHCRAERDALAAVLRDVSRVEMAEPSPLFWDRLSARVREGLANEPAPAAPGWLSWASGHWAWSVVTLALCVTAGSIGWYQWRQDEVAPRRAPGVARSMELRPERDRASAAGRLTPPMTDDDDVATTAPARLSPSPRIVPAASSDADWNLMMRVVEDVAWADEGQAGGLGSVRPGTTDAVVKELAPDERRELVRLLREEMSRQPSS
jgi:hypothetical protein